MDCLAYEIPGYLAGLEYHEQVVSGSSLVFYTDVWVSASELFPSGFVRCVRDS